MRAEEITFKEDQKFKVTNRADLRDELILLLQQAIEDPYNLSPQIKARIEELRIKLGMKTEKEMNEEEVIETKLSQDEMDDFVDYVLSFYGEDGLYDMGATVEMIQKATNEYLKKLDKDTTWGGGDSVDRERVRDIMIDMFNLKKKVTESDDDFEEFSGMVKQLVKDGHHPFDAARSVGEAMGLSRNEIREYVNRYMDSFK